METPFEVVIANVRYVVFGALLDGYRTQSVVILLPDGEIRRCYGPLYRDRSQSGKSPFGSPRHVELPRTIEPNETVYEAIRKCCENKNTHKA